MHAVGYAKSLPIDDPKSLEDVQIDAPVTGDNDLLVAVKAIAVNPVDTKIRQRAEPEQGHKIIGWDAVGEVIGLGDKVSGFELGDRVWYAGDLTRPGCNAEQQVVDYRIAAKAPESLSDLQAAAMPLTAITAYELLFDRLGYGINDDSQRSLLIIGSAGGVGSIMVQLAKTLTNATVIGTASRPESTDWVKQLGADAVIDHSKPLGPQLQNLPTVTDVLLLTHSEQYFDDAIEFIAPQGKIGIIDDPKEPLDITRLKQKSLSLHWEFMYTRSMFSTDDMVKQGQLLAHVAALVDEGKIKTTLGKDFGELTAANLRKAHQALEGGKTIGKIALTVPKRS